MANPETLAINETGKTKGTWTSQILYNDKSKFPVGTTSEWGYLQWEEENIDEANGNTRRIDILKASDDTVLIENIVIQENGLPTILFESTAELEDIKIRVKLYYNTSDPPISKPIVKNIRINYYNWSQHQLITNIGKSVILNRSFKETSNMNKYLFHYYGGIQNTLNKSTTSIENPISLFYTNLPEGNYLGSNTALPGTMVLGETGSSGEGYLQLGPLSYSKVEIDREQRILTLTTTVRDLPESANLGIVGIGNYKDLFFCGGARVDYELKEDKLYEIKTRLRIISKISETQVMTYEGSSTLLKRVVYDDYETEYSPILQFEAGSGQTELHEEMTELYDLDFGPENIRTTAISPEGNRASPFFLMRSNEGNGTTYNSFAWLSSVNVTNDYDPNSFTNYNNAFNFNLGSYASKNTSTSVMIGKIFNNQKFVKFVQVKGMGKSFSSNSDSSCVISIYVWDGFNWNIRRQVAGIRAKQNVEVSFNTESIEEINVNTRGIAIGFDIVGNSSREQRLNVCGIDSQTRDLDYKGEINSSSDFPTLGDVEDDWSYLIESDVTDNDPSKTNTGLKFKAGSRILWKGDTWTKMFGKMGFAYMLDSPILKNEYKNIIFNTTINLLDPTSNIM
jgi:hypothetical protein